jgi:ribosomal protein S15
MTQACQASKAAENKHQDPYALAQSKARRAANVSRQATLQTERSKALGDPVRGINTAFVQSFDTALNLQDDSSDAGSAGSASTKQTELLNHFVSAEQLKQTLEQSRDLTTPIRSQLQDPAAFDDRVAQQKQDHTNAMEALSRIVALENASAKDRLRVNIQRCIETFGRHNTDKALKPKPSVGSEDSKRTARVGPDTGSSEVQAAILTAKIRGLANFLETRGKKDMANKRNLRLLVHKRQKHLAYLRRKERGGERWQNLIATLGLTEGTWRGEITL